MVKKKPSVTDRARQVGDELSNLGRKTWLVGLGAVATVEEEVTGVFDRLVTKGEDVEKSERIRVPRVFDDAVKKSETLRKRVEEEIQGAVSGALHRAGVPDRAEIQTLIQRVEQLTEKIQTLETRG